MPSMDIRRLAHRARRPVLDWAVPLAILALGAVDVARQAHTRAYPGAPLRHVVFIAVAAVAIGLRRRAPIVAPTIAIAVVTWWTQLWPPGDQGPFEGFLLLVAAAYCLGAAPDRRRLAIGGGILLLWFALGLAAGVVGGRAGDVAPIAVWLLVGYGVGYLISRRTEQALRATEAARMLAAEQERETARAVEEERSRIARELHDVVAHALSVIVVQAGVERRALPGADTEQIDAAFGSIERVGREALDDLRRLLGLLRRTDDVPALTPQPGLAQLDELVARVRDAGLAVEVRHEGEGRSALPAGLDLTAYRIVQEALTNVLKHAGAHRVRVGVTYSRTALDLEVCDDGSTPVTAFPVGGNGLIGMRERVKVFGGTLTAGCADGGGWTVHARLPVPTRGAR